MEIAPDVMKRFLSAFGAGSSAAESSSRTGIASRQQALDFVQRQQQLAMQERGQEAEIAQGNMRLAYQQQAQSAQNALAAQKIQQDTERAAMQYKLQEQQQGLERSAFVERLKAQKALAEQNKLELQSRVDQVQKDNEFKKEELALRRQSLDKKSEFQLLVEERRRGQEESKVIKQNQDLFQKNYNTFIKLLSSPVEGANLSKDKPADMSTEEFATVLAQQATQKAIGGGNKVDPSTYTPEPTKVDTTGNSQQTNTTLQKTGNILVDAATADKMTKAMEGKKSGDIVVIDGKKYRVK